MCKRLRWFQCITLAVLVSFSAALPVFAGEQDAEGWKKREEQNGVIGYERKVEGSKYLQTKAETTIDAPMEVLLEVLMDIPSFPQWMHKCAKSRFPWSKKAIITVYSTSCRACPWAVRIAMRLSKPKQKSISMPAPA